MDAFDTDDMEFFSMFVQCNLNSLISRMKDDEKIKWSIQFILAREKVPIIIPPDVKSAEIAMNYIDQANQNFQTSSGKSSLELYTLGVIHAPPDSKELALAYGNRSAVLYNEGFYEDSMLDIGRALSIGYPDKMVAKLYVRKARCVYALNNDKMSAEVEEAVADARRLLEKMNDDKKKHMNNILDRLAMKSSKKTPLKELDYRPFLPNTPADNPSIIGASSAIEIKYSKKCGCYLVATRDIQAGEILFMHEAFASAVEFDYLMKYCWNCSKRIRAGVPCRECHTVIYCSEICRDKAWRDYHDIECRIIPSLIYMGMVKWDFLIFKITAKALKEAGSGEKLKKMVEEMDKIKDPIKKCYTGKSLDVSKYASIYTTTESNYTSTASNERALYFAVKSMAMAFYLAATTKMCGEKIPNFRDLLGSQIGIFIGTLIMKHFHICHTKSRPVMGLDGTGTKFIYGCSLNPLLDLMHHNCDPMVRGVSAGDVRAAVTIQKIKKGQQIFANTAPAFWKEPVEERQRFMQMFSYECLCKPCLQNWGPTTLSSFPHIPGSVPADVQELFGLFILEGFNSFLLRIPIGKLPSFLAFLSTLMNRQEVSEYPTQGVVLLKHFMMTIYDHVSLLLDGN